MKLSRGMTFLGLNFRARRVIFLPHHGGLVANGTAVLNRRLRDGIPAVAVAYRWRRIVDACVMCDVCAL